MKKTVIIAVLILSTNLIFAQRNSLSVSYGTGSTDQLSNVIFDNSALYFIGPLAVSYHRALTGKERLSLGGSLVFDRGKFPNYEYRIFTLAPEMKLKYTKAVQKFNLYGLLGVGVTFGAESNETVNSKITHTNIQFTPIGIEFGNKLKGFFELGIGYKGIISGGISYRF